MSSGVRARYGGGPRGGIEVDSSRVAIFIVRGYAFGWLDRPMPWRGARGYVLGDLHVTLRLGRSVSDSHQERLRVALGS